MSHHFIDFKDVFFSYPDGRQAIRGISLYISHGETIGLVGANGAGKSTLLQLLLGLLFPTKGEISVGGTPVSPKTLSLIRQRVGYTFQNSDEQLFMNTVYDDVAFGPRNYGLSEDIVDVRVKMALERVGATHLIDRAPYKLSGGEKKLAAMASVISMEPDVLVMDEPTAALDPKARRRTINILKEFTHTKIIATHDLDMVLDVCDRIVILSEGRILVDGKALDILKNVEILEEAGLEMPLSLQGCPVCKNSKK